MTSSPLAAMLSASAQPNMLLLHNLPVLYAKHVLSMSKATDCITLQSILRTHVDNTSDGILVSDHGAAPKAACFATH